MSALPEQIKLQIVQALACFDTPSQVAKAVNAEFGLTVSPQQCERYDPTKRAGAALSKKYREIFTETRKTFLEDTSTIGVSHRAVRLRTLQRLIDRAESQGNIGMTAQLLEQVAKETGDAYTNRRELTGKNGAPFIPTNPTEMTDDQLAAIAAGGGSSVAGKATGTQ
jgi:hypothetical protein